MLQVVGERKSVADKEPIMYVEKFEGKRDGPTIKHRVDGRKMYEQVAWVNPYTRTSHTRISARE